MEKKLFDRAAEWRSAVPVPVLETAVALGAPVIRIWAGNCTPDSISEDAFRTLAADIRCAADLH